MVRSTKVAMVRFEPTPNTTVGCVGYALNHPAYGKKLVIFYAAAIPRAPNVQLSPNETSNFHHAYPIFIS